jgi:superfamily II DNA or RNA helicase
MDIIAPGARVEIRDEEWIVRRIDHVGNGKAIHVIGVSELARGKEAIFLEQLESKIKVLAPEDTELVPDQSPKYRQSKLYIESQLQRYIPPMQEKPELYLGHRAAMRVLPFQLKPALQALEQPRQRILIADAVGLGKTLECGVLLSELMRRGRGQRILVLAMKSILTQFQKEMWSRFSIPLIRLDSAGIKRIRRDIPSNHNPFDYHDKVIISIDTLKQDTEYRRYLENTHWDIIVIDEAHNVADRSGLKNFYGPARSQALRTRLARLLSTHSDTLIMLSATPHDGKAQSFASLMNMLNPTAIANPHQYQPEDIRGLFVRRFKKDVLQEVGGSFQEREIHCIKTGATGPEEEAFEALVSLKFQKLDHSKGGRMLFATTLEKALFSSPAACIQTIKNRIATLNKRDDEDFSPDIEALEHLKVKLEAIGPESFSRFQSLIHLIQKTMKWKQSKPDDRLVIFTERIETLKYLEKHLPTILNLNDNQLEVLYGSMSDLEQQRVVEEFGKAQSKVRLLIASDVASEGINLHYLSHRMIHFDIPWSLMTFQQRNGRIDRYGQEFKPEIYYLMTDSNIAKIKGDHRILELLIEKDQQAIENIGDPSALTGKYNEEDETELTAQAMEQGLAPEAFEQKCLQANTQASALEAMLAAWQAVPKGAVSEEKSPDERTRNLPSLYPNALDYVCAGLEQLEIRDYSVHDDNLGFKLNISPENLPGDLKVRFKSLPSEVLRAGQGLNFCMDVARIQDDIARCRGQENAWPEWHYLWEQHPFMDWLNDRVTASFGRHQAPVIRLNTLASDETLYLLSGLFPSRKGHPIIWEWPGVLFKAGRFASVLKLEAVLDLTQFDQKTFANPGGELDLTELKKNLPAAVKKAQGWMDIQKGKFEEQFKPRIESETKALKTLKERQVEQLELDFENPVGRNINQKSERNRQIEATFNDYQSWVEDSLTVASQPYLQLIAVFAGV